MINKIIVEGPNNVGKTTFINSLLARPEFENWSVEHVTSAAPNDEQFYTETLAKMQNVIFDRHCVGELVYPKLYKRPAKMNASKVKKLLSSHAKDTLVVFVDADVTFVANACDNKREPFILNDVIREREEFNSTYEKLKDLKNVYRIVNHLNSNYFGEMTSFGLVNMFVELIDGGEYYDLRIG